MNDTTTSSRSVERRLERTTPLRVRDFRGGKHHLSVDHQITLCNREVYGFGEVQADIQWADEDCCKVCARQVRPTAT